MTIDEAALQCRSASLTGWDLVAFAQSLVNRQMTYSYSNSFDMPRAAFEKGRGYCWHQAGALQLIFIRLRITSRMVHAVKNEFPKMVREGVALAPHLSGHVWCRVTMNGSEKDVCPGHPDNRPGVIHFKPVSSVRNWNPVIAFFSYLGSAMVNARRLKALERLKQQQACKWNPELCPCKKKNCPRYKNCDTCREHHHTNGGLPYCER